MGEGYQFDGNPMPLLYAVPDQIDAADEILGQHVTRHVIVNSEQPIERKPLARAIFTLDRCSIGPGASLNEACCANSRSNPAAPKHRGTGHHLQACLSRLSWLTMGRFLIPCWGTAPGGW